MPIKTIRQAFEHFRGGDTLRGQLLRGGAGIVAVKVGYALLSFGLAVVLARMLGTEGYGVYSFAYALLTLVAIPTQVGIPQLIVRETAKAHALENWACLLGLWRWGGRMVVMVSIITMLLLGALLWLFASQMDPARLATVVAGVLLIPVIALSNVKAACLCGLRYIVSGQYPEKLFRPALMLTLASIVIVARLFEPRPQSIMLIYLFSALVAYVLSSVLLWRKRPKELLLAEPEYDVSAWRKAVFPLALISGLNIINLQTGIVILGYVRGNAEVGIYRAVFQVSLLVVFGLQAINTLLHPHFARFHATGNHEKLQRLVTVSSRVIFLIACPPFIIFFFFSSDVLAIVYGEVFIAGGLALAILTAGQFIYAAMGSAGALLNMTGHERDTLRTLGISVLSNILLTIVLTPYLGMYGVASAASVSLILQNFLLRRCVRDRLNIECSGLVFWR